MPAIENPKGSGRNLKTAFVGAKCQALRPSGCPVLLDIQDTFGGIR
jgi:hypothetical protein